MLAFTTWPRVAGAVTRTVDGARVPAAALLNVVTWPQWPDTRLLDTEIAQAGPGLGIGWWPPVSLLATSPVSS